LQIIRLYAQSVHWPAYMDNGLETMPLADRKITNQLIKRHSLID